MGRREAVARRVAIAVVVVLALLAWWNVRRPAVRPVDPAPMSVPVRSATPAFAHPEPVAAPSNDPYTVAERAAKEAAISALAALSGRNAVVCPPLQDGDSDSGSTSWSWPEGAICVVGPGIVCAMSQPAGSSVIRRDDDQVPLAVYRWDTGPDGATICVLEPPIETRVRLRVVDRQGVARAGVSVCTADFNTSAMTDAAGWATLPLVGNGTNWVIALGDDGAVSSPVGVASGGMATIVLGNRPADIAPGEVMTEVRMALRLEAVEDLEAALESSTPEVTRELSELLDVELRMIQGPCETSDVPTCRAWKARP